MAEWLLDSVEAIGTSVEILVCDVGVQEIGLVTPGMTSLV